MKAISKRQLGNISLLIAVIGLIITKLLLHYGIVENVIWRIISTGFEAATVGGLADWFAVTALFREIPIPVLRKHTDIIIKNREKLTEGIVDLVTTKWLAPEVIKEKISQLSISRNIIDMLHEPQHKARTLELIKDIFAKLSDSLDSPLLATFLQGVLKEKMNEVNLAVPIGHWLKARIEQGDHHQLWEMLLDSVQISINDNSTREIVVELIEKQIANYKDKDFLKKIFVSLAEFTDAIDVQVVADKIMNALNQFIREAKNNPDYPIRVKFDQSLLDFADDLIQGNPKAQGFIDDIQEKLINNSDAEQIILNVLSGFKSTLLEQLEDHSSIIQEMIQTNFDHYLEKLDTNQEVQEKIDSGLKKAIFELLVKYYPEIGNMVRTSLSILSNNELVLQIEEKVGDDLQYIRLNGAIVGGLAGMVIAVIGLLFSDLF